MDARYSFIILSLEPGQDCEWLSLRTASRDPKDSVSTLEPVVQQVLRNVNVRKSFRLRFFRTSSIEEGSCIELQERWRKKFKGIGPFGILDFAGEVDPNVAFAYLELPRTPLGVQKYKIGLIVMACLSPSYHRKDVTRNILNAWEPLQPITVLPRIQDLTDILDVREPLPENAKIPISQGTADAIISRPSEFRDRCTPEDLGLLFRISEDETAIPLQIPFTCAVFQAPPTDITDKSFIHFWDSNIAKILEIILPDGCLFRNTSWDVSTRNLAPDYGFLLKNVAPFRGEECGPRDYEEDPKKELGEKLIWTYSPAPYVLGYYARGTELTFVAISPPGISEEHPKVTDLFSTSLKGKADRIKNAVRMIKLGPIIASIAERIGPQGETEYVEHMRNNKRIVIGGKYIQKTYEGAEGIEVARRLRSVYAFLRDKKVPNVDRVVAPSTDENTLYLGPKGLARRPDTKEEVFDAVTCVLEAIIVLHRGPNPMIHRDIRWQNIVQSATDTSKWVLIGWEDAATVPAPAAPSLARESHCPKVFEDNHGGEVDIWAVGRLLLDNSQSMFDRDLQNLAARMMAYELTAQEALEAIQSFKSNQCL